MGSKTKLTTEAGIQIDDNRTVWTADPRGAGLLSAWHLFTVATTKANPTSQ